MIVRGRLTFAAICIIALAFSGCGRWRPDAAKRLQNYALNYETPVDGELQRELESIDRRVRGKAGIPAESTCVGVLDLNTFRLAMIHPDQIEYGASVPKIGILLAYFQLHPEAAKAHPQVRHELGRMIKISDNEMAAKYSRQLGLTNIQNVLNSYHLYDAAHGGGIWVGKHYGRGDERYGDPVANHSHAVTVRQLLRYYLMLEQGRLVSPEASKTMAEIFASPEIPHLNDRFVKGLEGRSLTILRKSGWWEDWLHDSAIISGPGRKYILVALTHHPRGDEYLEAVAREVDEEMRGKSKIQTPKSKEIPRSQNPK